MNLHDYGQCYDPTTPGWTGIAQPGVVAFSRAVMDLFPWFGSMGIVRDKSRCMQKSSTHCKGRAWDCACNANSATGLKQGNDLAALLITNHRYLGLQRIIWNRREWDCLELKWEAYSGPSPHLDHLHLEFCWQAARDKPLTVEYVKMVLGGEEDFLAKLTEAEQREVLEKVRRIDTALIEKDDAVVKAVTGRSTGGVMSGIWKLLSKP